MNEKRKVAIVVGILAIIIVFIAISMVSANMQRKKVVDSFNEAFASKTEKLIYLGRPGCSACQSFKPTLEKVVDAYKIDYLDLNTDQINESQLHKMIDQLELDWENFGTPTIAIVKDKKVIKSNIGAIGEEEFVTFLQEGNLISKE